MSHDPLCPVKDEQACQCDLIAKVRRVGGCGDGLVNAGTVLTTWQDGYVWRQLRS